MNVRGSGRGSGVEQQHKVALKLITDAIDCMPDVRSKVVEYLLTRYGYEITLRLINLSATASPQGGGGGT